MEQTSLRKRCQPWLLFFSPFASTDFVLGVFALLPVVCVADRSASGGRKALHGGGLGVGDAWRPSLPRSASTGSHAFTRSFGRRGSTRVRVSVGDGAGDALLSSRFVPPRAVAHAKVSELKIGGVADDRAVASSQQCLPLGNRGTHFTAEIEVGTPAQRFDVVADTGSSYVIVPSCLCVDSGSCNVEDGCFTGTNRSVSFSMDLAADPNQAGLQGNIPVAAITFGSGTIEAAVAEDVVRVAGVEAKLENGLLLMLSKDLDMDGPFGGILGLGIPGSSNLDDSPPDARSSATFHGNATDASVAGGNTATSRTHDRQNEDFKMGPGFLEKAGVGAFMICFNDASDGAMRFQSGPSSSSLGSVGRMHWALDFRGVSIASSTSAEQTIGRNNGVAPRRLSFCGDNAPRQSGQRAACGAIPDSGTTVIMAPEKHIVELFEALCDGWSRCRDAVASQQAARSISSQASDASAAISSNASFGASDRSGEKHITFIDLLDDCQSWMGSSPDGLDELPVIHFHLAGAGGEQQTLALSGAGYVLEMEQDEVLNAARYLEGVLPVLVAKPSGEKRRVCTPAFGAADLMTRDNGLVWILGGPFFYEYTVGHDLVTKPPGIFFAREPCRACVGGSTAAAKPSTALVEKHESAKLPSAGAELDTSKLHIAELRSPRRTPRRISGPLRISKFDFSRGL
eukprot:TRINITY_DN18274_c0_g1_i1.p1 TRINITY_DN18274_c0_g1~~TRINITY_DN18274_c0_g1_i1.p1  ORF type:complete len:783 (-),score=120.24 TRINITY_DN18274_c0_g1_i1:199-2247(-)